MQYRLALFLVMILSSFSTFTQERLIRGEVKDAQTGEGLIGANIYLKDNPAYGTVTDFDGNFELSVPQATKVLVFSYTGYQTLEEDIAGRDYVVVSLSAGQLLQDVVIIGYGTVKREDATGVVQSVNSESFNRGAITGPQELLAGKIAGVAITSDGSPGGGAKIRIRGESSLNASNDPLIVVDGVPLDNSGLAGNRNPLNIINPNDIESFTVLKDASAAAIYGNRASGGVIIITTKKSKLGQAFRLSYNGNVSVQSRTRSVPVLSADEFRAFVSSDEFQFRDKAVSLLGDANTNWQDVVFRDALATDHNVSGSGSIGLIPYRVSLGYTNKNGILKTDNFNRTTAAINLNPGFLDNRLQINVGAKAMVSNNHFADRGAIGAALSFDPTQPILDPGNRFGGYTTWTLPNGNPNTLAPANPLALLELKDDNSTVRQYILNASADYRFAKIPDLRANLNLGMDISRGEGTIVIPNFASFAFDEIYGGGVDNSYKQKKQNSLLEFYLNYTKKLNRHSFDVMAGYSWQRFFESNSFRNSNTAGTPLPSITIERNNIDRELYLLSLFTRLNYSFDNRYLLTLSVRRDGTSRFAPENRWGYFPAAALAVKMIENDNSYLNSVKLRAGVGLTGQQDIGGNFYPYIGQYQLSFSNAAYQFGNDTILTLRPNGYNSSLKWEETVTYNIGTDISIMKNKLSASIDAYQRNTRDLLNFVPLPALSNLTNEGDVNVGEMVSKGLELAINYNVLNSENVSWNVSANFAYNISEITKLTISDDPDYIGIRRGGIAGGVGSNIQVHSVGFRPSSFFVYEQLYDEAGKLLEGKFRDQNSDGVINDKDLVRFKSPDPFWTIGITSNLTIGNFDFSFAGRANLGNYIYNNIKTDIGYINRIYATTNYLNNVHRSALDLNVFDQAKLTFSDHFVVNGSFFRMDHITMGYNFSKLLGRFFRVYATVQNPFVITSYDGLDPEIGNGIDNNIYPRPRTLLFGLSVDF